jgi:hypothetical protein
MRDQVDATLLYAFSKREYLRMQPRFARYYTQNGDFLGSGNHFSWELGYHIRTEYPDWTVRLTGAHNRFKTASPLDFDKIMPLISPQLIAEMQAECAAAGVSDASCNQLIADGVSKTPSVYTDVDAYGLCAGFGEAYRHNYTQAWRPYFDYCTTQGNLGGQGYNAMLGLAGSVAGHDHLAVTFSQGLGGANYVNGLVRELTVRYRYYFDRY